MATLLRAPTQRFKKSFPSENSHRIFTLQAEMQCRRDCWLRRLTLHCLVRPCSQAHLQHISVHLQHQQHRRFLAPPYVSWTLRTAHRLPLRRPRQEQRQRCPSTRTQPQPVSSLKRQQLSPARLDAAATAQTRAHIEKHSASDKSSSRRGLRFRRGEHIAIRTRRMPLEVLFRWLAHLRDLSATFLGATRRRTRRKGSWLGSRETERCGRGEGRAEVWM